MNDEELFRSIYKYEPNIFNRILEYVFYPCYTSEEIKHHKLVRIMSDKVITDSKYLKFVIIDSNVNKIPRNAFCGCFNLTTIEMSDSVTEIGDFAFSNCSSLKTIVLSNNIKTIGQNAFRYCFNLTSIYIPDSVTFIDGWCFYGCSNLSQIRTPRHTKFGYLTFLGCTKLNFFNK